MANQRRRRGTGSLYQDAHGVWWAALDIDGKLVRRRAASAKGAREKLKELQAIRVAAAKLREDGIKPTGGDQTVGDFINEWHEQVLLRKHLRDNTLSTHRATITLHILPYFNDFALKALEFEHVQAWVDELSPSMAHRAYTLLNRACGWAVNRRYIRFNPCAHVILPRYTPQKQRPWTAEEIQRLLRVATTGIWPLFYAVLYTLGLRRGEALALEWSDVNWTEKTLKIERQVQAVDDPDNGIIRLVVNPPKTDAGVRLIGLPDGLLCMLADVYDATMHTHAQSGVEWTGQGLLFAARGNKYLWPPNINETFCKHRRAAELPEELHLHSFRHTAASWLDEAGASDAVKADILGHKKQAITLHYTHSSIVAQRSALNKIETLFISGGALPPFASNDERGKAI